MPFYRRTSTAKEFILAMVVLDAQRRKETPVLPVLKAVDDDEDDNNDKFNGFTYRSDLECQRNHELRMETPITTLPLPTLKTPSLTLCLQPQQSSTKNTERQRVIVL